MNSFKLFADSNCIIAENPLWHIAEQALYWKDSECIFRKPMIGNPHQFECFSLPVGLIGGFVFVRDGGLLIFAQHGRVWYWCAGRDPILVAELPGSDEKTYFNDLIADSEGRVYCGVLAYDFFNPATRGKYGSLWRFDPDRSFHCLENETGVCPNGMGFSPDLKSFYFTVSDEQKIYRYDYDQKNGNINNRESLINAPGCDGMTVDAEGCLWIAHWGGPLVRYSSEGQLLKKYSFPPEVRAISSVTFGGADLKTIFVSTANYPNDIESANFLTGGVYSMHQKIAGISEFLF